MLRDREHLFAEDLITAGAGVADPQLPVLTKVSCLVDALRMGRRYKLVEKLWAQFVLTSGPVNTEVAWTRDEILVGSVNSGVTSSHSGFALLFCFQSFISTGTLPRILSCVVGWAKAHHLHSLEFEEREVIKWAFIRTWENTFRRVAVAVSDRFSSDTTPDLGSGQLWLLWVVGRPLFLFLVDRMCWLTVKASFWEVGTVASWLSTITRFASPETMLAREVFFHRWLFGSVLDDENYCRALEGAVHRDWMMSPSGLRRAIVTGKLSMASLLEVFSNNVGVCSLIVVYPKETGRRTDGDSSVI